MHRNAPAVIMLALAAYACPAWAQAEADVPSDGSWTPLIGLLKPLTHEWFLAAGAIALIAALALLWWRTASIGRAWRGEKVSKARFVLIPCAVAAVLYLALALAPAVYGSVRYTEFRDLLMAQASGSPLGYFFAGLTLTMGPILVPAFVRGRSKK